MELSRIRRMAVTAAVTVGLCATAAVSAPAASAATRLGGVDMQRACNTQYPPSFGLKATVMNQRDAYSWRCTAPFDSTRQINVNAACANQYGGGAYQGLADARNPYSWYCQR